MARSIFWFTCGEFAQSATASTLLDAWWVIERREEMGQLPAEFRTPGAKIVATNNEGETLATRTYDGWHAALLRDTYGDNWREILDSAEEKSR